MTALIPHPGPTHSRARGLAAVLALIMALALLSALAPPAVAQDQAPQNVTVAISDFAFLPGELQVHAGDTVTWVNEDVAPHDATSTAGPAAFASGTLQQGDSFSFTFTTAGTYSYVCTIHPDMVATITVVEHEPAAPVQEPPAKPVPAAEEPAPEGSAAEEPAAAESVADDPAPAEESAVAQAPAEPGTAQVVSAARQGRQLDPLLIVAGVALGVATLCLLLISTPATRRR